MPFVQRRLLSHELHFIEQQASPEALRDALHLFYVSVDTTSTLAPPDTIAHGPHQRPTDYCPKPNCTGRDWGVRLRP